ncbi:hypothetical protein Glove_452g6 [Diversispora epigaea]|uniref:18S rRNA factor 2 n=1 Tax=Diversispora epigaea TaxID=1348612 RepID=A0A397GYA9_9GLOM|nr:hypothetical protein Glove_452g6 [Diversispora epigaea]
MTDISEMNMNSTNNVNNMNNKNDTNNKNNTSKIVKPLTSEKLKKFEKEQNKTGLVYLSRIPPFMKPSKIKHLLSRYGEIGRAYLVPEDHKIRERRAKYRGDRRQNYTEGWIEFLDKKVAKNVASTLNTQPIGGKKRSYYYDDLWNIKYLPKFKWNHLTEQIAYENAMRTKRLQAEISQGHRENKEYIKKVEKAKMLQNIENKKQRKTTENDDAQDSTFVEDKGKRKRNENDEDEKEDQKKFQQNKRTITSISTEVNNPKYRKFKQRKIVTNGVVEEIKQINEFKSTSSKFKGIINKVFGK